MSEGAYRLEIHERTRDVDPRRVGSDEEVVRRVVRRGTVCFVGNDDDGGGGRGGADGRCGGFVFEFGFGFGVKKMFGKDDGRG